MEFIVNHVKWTILIAALATSSGIKPMEPEPAQPIQSPTESWTLDALPAYIIGQVCNNLSFSDIANLRRTCKNLQTAWSEEKVIEHNVDKTVTCIPWEEQVAIQQQVKDYRERSITLEIRGLEIVDEKLRNHHNPVFLIMTNKQGSEVLERCSHLGQLVKKLQIGGRGSVTKSDIAAVCRWAPTLEKLKLHHRSIELPEEFLTLKRLTFLDVQGKHLSQETLKLICRLSNLQKLILKDCGLKEFPQNITSSSNVKILDLVNNHLPQNGLAGICDAFSKLEYLIVCNDNPKEQLTSLPTEIANLQYLKRLILSGTKLTADTIRPVCYCPSLQELDLSASSLSELPEEIGLLSTTLKVLILCNNKFSFDMKEHIKQLLPKTEIRF